jgi:hypothetical protein
MKLVTEFPAVAGVIHAYLQSNSGTADELAHVRYGAEELASAERELQFETFPHQWCTIGELLEAGMDIRTADGATLRVTAIIEELFT